LFRDENGNEGLQLTPEAMEGLRIKPVEVKLATKPRPLPPQIGTINYDVDRLYTIRPRFQGEVAEFRMFLDNDSPSWWTKLRPIRFGDKVKPDDILTVIWSRDLGEKKAALVDAMSALYLSQAMLKRHEKLFEEGALSLATLRATERQVQQDSNNVLTAERTLKMWKLTDEEIKAVKEEAKIIADQQKVRSADKEMRWARLEVKVPPNADDPNRVLTVVEKNTSLNDMVDPSKDTPLFRLADLRRLQIWVHPPEEYLPILRERLKNPGAGKLQWDIRFQGDSPNTPPLKLDVVQIAPSLEPNQHTPMVMGYLNNPDGNRYLIGQFVTATIYVDPDENTVVIPTDALNEVENESLVFVQTDAAKRKFTLRRVQVVSRFKDVTFVRTKKLTPDEQKASDAEVKLGRRRIQPLQKGEQVITRGVVELTAALDNLLSLKQSEGAGE
jgi:cobalt-zinc-cadmium efflux system membrane fusion protein